MEPVGLTGFSIRRDNMAGADRCGTAGRIDMPEKKKSLDRLFDSLQERAKELDCLYRIEELLSKPDEPITDIYPKLLRIIPTGLQFPEICKVKIMVEGATYTSTHFKETAWTINADIKPQEIILGSISIYYLQETPVSGTGPFLDEEVRLVQTIAERLGHFIMYTKMKEITREWESTSADVSSKSECEWRFVLDMLRQTDLSLYYSISRKMLNHLSWSGIAEAEKVLQSFGAGPSAIDEDNIEEWNRPHRRRALGLSPDFSSVAFKIAVEYLNDEEILRLIQKWIQEDKLSFLVQVVNRNLSLAEVADAIRRYHHLAADEPEIPSPSKRGIRVSLIRRFLSDQLQYINVAKNFVEVKDFYNLLQNVIFSHESHGRLGGKSAGMYLASQILEKKGIDFELLSSIKIPKTWYISSDVVLHFMHYNNFDEVVEQKYKEINQVRLEYPHIVQSFKNAHFPSDIIKGLSMALDDFDRHPLIVRSSSLLEDRMGAAFSGKYKSLFLANQGGKQERLDALMDAIAEVYASTFSPDPIEYRNERGLIDFGEEMGIMIQEVVGRKVGKYYLPAYAGVAVSNNEFRWSPRINRKDGLIRLVPGLGTRAVDRLSDDYPILLAPGQPNLRVNVTTDEVIRYSPEKIDVINLETNDFETLNIKDFLKEVGYEFPGVNNMVSICEDNHLRQPMGMNIDFEKDDLVVTFEGLINKTKFVKRMECILQTLEKTIGTPIDVEFASDGKYLYLLQCRPQSYSEQDYAPPIPKDLPEEQIVFSANKHISNGVVPDVTHIVYVDPLKYAALTSPSAMVEIGRAVGRLNKVLPKRKFILMGPGRWGSRGDIKLGVSVTYSDINNCAALIEIARKKGNYVPDLSFGTHFFQDLVEANIKYLPLYPDDDGIIFNEDFLTTRQNILKEVVPEYAHLSDTIRLIDLPCSTSGLVMQLLMNAELESAVAILTKPGEELEMPNTISEKPGARQTADYWRWRLQMAERIARETDPERFGVAAMYLIGSTKNASATPSSDIDLLVHFIGKPRQRDELIIWLEGWSIALSEINYMRTGYKSDHLLDVQIITDRDIVEKRGYAAKIGAATDPAMKLPMPKKK